MSSDASSPGERVAPAEAVGQPRGETRAGQTTAARRAGGALLLSGGLSAAVSALLLTPGLVAGPSLDAGVFTLVGSLFRQGRLPYLDAWDHKPPVIYLLDAAAQSVAPGADPWIPSWLVSVGAIALAGMVVTLILRRAGLGWEAVLAGVATSAAASQQVVSLGGGLTECVAILPAAAAVWLSLQAGVGRAALAGAAVAIAALTSIPAIAVAGAVAVLWWRRPQRTATFVAGGLGAAAVGALAVALLALGGALPAAFDAVVRYSAAFHALASSATTSSATVVQAAGAVLSLLFLIVPAGLGALAARHAADAQTRIVAVSSIGWIVLALLLFVVEGRFETHYATVLVVPLGLLAGFGLQRVGSLGARPRMVVSVPIAAGLLVSTLVVAWETPAMVQPVADEAARASAVAEAVRNASDATDTIFVWGNAPGVYLDSERMPATRFVYVYPLMTPGYSTNAQVATLVRDLQAHPPRLIVDAGSLGPGLAGFPPLLVPRPVTAKDPRVLDLIGPLREFVASRYELMQEVDGWPIYRLRDTTTGG